MKKCPNKNLPEYKLLEQNLGVEEAYRIYLANNEEVPTYDEVLKLIPQNNVNYTLKTVEILQSDKAKEIFAKGEKNKWSLDKILSELNIPKEQKQLILSLYKTDREEIALELASKYGYTIEINTAKDKTDYRFKDNAELADYGGGSGYEDFEFEGSKYIQKEELDFDGENRTYFYKDGKRITKKEFNETAKKLPPKIIDKNSSYYSNLTVPGGTNYTENEISTPLITPSIKGHAQFSTDNGIGWFRADEQAPQIKGWQKDEVDWMDSESAIYNAITPDDKIIWGHPTIGKTTAKKQKGFLDFDTDFKPLVAQKLGLPKSQQTSIGLNEWRKATGNEEAFNTAMREVWALAKKQAKSQNKILMVSDMIFLRENQSDFDKIINISSDTFINRASKRGDDVSSLQNWKNNIDKVLNNIDSKKIITTDKYLSELFEENAKTRRILEVQSDLFQKWRNNFEFKDNRYTAKKDDKNVWHYYKNGNKINANEYAKTWETFLDTYLDNADAFTKLLQKDNNWVTFFIKSIIQDSAKKDYEKVLFPSGDTASKVEGHTTLEEFKKQKEDRIETLENENKGRYIVISANNKRDIFTSKQRAEEVVEFYNKEIDEDNPFTVKAYYEYKPLQKEILEANNKEIKQRKQELERVEIEGFGALRPIYNFYENTITNILKKQGFNPNLITDKYGNTWNEIILDTNIKEKTKIIQFENIKLNSLQEKHYINIATGVLDDSYIYRQSKNLTQLSIDEIKKDFIDKFQLVVDSPKFQDKKELNTIFLNQIKEDNSPLWEAIKENQERKYFVKETRFDGNEDEKLKTANWSEVKEVSTARSVGDIIKRTINRLKKRVHIQFNADGSISEIEHKANTNTYSGLPERLEYRDFAGGLFLKYLGVDSMQDFLNRTLNIAKYNSSFYELYDMLVKDEDLLSTFYMTLVRQSRPANIILKTNKKITIKEEGTTFAQNMANRLSGIIFNNIKNGYYTKDVYNQLNVKENNLFVVDKGKKVPLEKDLSIKTVLNILDVLKIEVPKEDIVNLYRVFNLEEVNNTFSSIFNGLINPTSSGNLFERKNRYDILKELKAKTIAELDAQIINKDNKEIVRLGKELTKINKELKEFKFDNNGRVFALTTFIEKVRIDIPDTVTTSVKKTQKSTIQWNDYVGNFFTILKANPEEGLNTILDMIGFDKETGKIDLPEYKNSIIFNKLIKNVEGKLVLNIDYINQFDYNEDGGLKDTLTNKAFEYDDWNKKDFIYKTLAYHAKKEELTTQYMPTPSDQASIKLITMPKWKLTKDEVIDIQNDYKSTLINSNFETIKQSDWFKDVFKTVLQEIDRMDTAFKLLFVEEEYYNNRKLVVKPEVLNNEVELSLHYHYILDKKTGKPVYLDSNNNPTGKVFSFLNFKYEVNGETKTLNDLKETNNINDDNKIILSKYFDRNKFELATYDFIKWHIDTHIELFAPFEKFLDANILSDVNRPFEQIAAEAAINNYLFKIAMQELFGDTLNDVGNLNAVYKRAKHSPGSNYAIKQDKRKESFLMLEVEDIILPTIKLSKNRSLTNVDIGDGFSYITRAEKLNRLERTGKLKEYRKAKEAFLQGDNSVIDKIQLSQDKNFYYDNSYNFKQKKRVSQLVKNSDIAIDVNTFKGTQLEELFDYLDSLGEELKYGIQLNFKSAVKKGNSNLILKLHDENGNLNLTDEIKEKIKNNLRPAYYSKLVKVMDTKLHIKDTKILLGTQLSKGIITNLNNDTLYNGKTGQEIAEEFFSLLDANLEEANKELKTRLKNKGKYITEQSLGKILLENGINDNWDKNLLKAFKEQADGRLALPLYYGIFEDKIQSFLSSLYTNNITKQKHSGYHAFQIPNAFMGNKIKDGKKIKLSEKQQFLFTGEGIEWAKEKQTDTTLKCIELVKDKVLQMEVVVSRWSKHLDGKSIDDLDAEVLTSLGFRIPTEGKFSSFVFKVVGFLPDTLEGTIIVPNGFTGITGSDFDIDSIYVMTKNINSEAKVIKFLDENTPIKERFDLFTKYNKAKDLVNKNEIKQAKQRKSFELYKQTLNKNISKEEKELNLDWFNSEFDTNLKSFYQIPKKYKELIEEQELLLNVLLENIANPDVKNKQLKKLKESKEFVENQLNYLKENQKDFEIQLKENLILTKEEQEAYENELKQEEEKVIENSAFAEFTLEQQNIRPARENRILDIFSEILLHPDNFDDVTSPSEYQDMLDATKDVNTLVKPMHPNILKDSIEMTNRILSNKNLKGNAVNLSNLVQISNYAKIESFVPVLYKANKEELAKGMPEFTTFKYIGVIKNEEEDTFSDKNFNGHNITNYTSKIVANIMDAVSNDLSYNMGDYTLNVFSIFPAFGVPNYKYPTYFISQGVVSELIKLNENKGVFSESLEDSEIEIVKNKIHTILRLTNALSGDLDEEQRISFFNKLDEAKEKNKNYLELEKEEKALNFKLANEKRKIFNSDELLEDVKYYLANKEIFDLVDLHFKTVNTPEYENYLNKIATLGIDNLQKYLVRQLAILNDFNKYKKLGEDLVKLSQLITADKKGAGPEIDTNALYIDKIKIAGYNEKFPFYINGKNAIQEIYPKLFYGEGKSAYRHLESKLIYSNIDAYASFNEFFIQETPILVKLIRKFDLDWIREGIKNEVRKDLISDLEFFQYNKEKLKQVLGIETEFIHKFDFTDITDKNVNAFSTLAAANQLYLIKEQFSKFFTIPINNHLLNELSFDERSLDPEERNHFIISKGNLSNKDIFAEQLTSMLLSDNIFISIFAKDLIRYGYYTEGWNFGNNITSVVPTDFVTGEIPIVDENGRTLDFNIGGLLRTKMLKALNGEWDNTDHIEDIYHRKNWKNNELVVPVKWRENEFGFIWKSSDEIKEQKNSKIRYANYVKNDVQINGIYQTKIYKRFPFIKEMIIGGNKKTITLGYFYIGLNKLEKWEFEDISVIEENNNSLFNETSLAEVEKTKDFIINLFLENMEEDVYIISNPKQENKETNTNVLENKSFVNENLELEQITKEDIVDINNNINNEIETNIKLNKEQLNAISKTTDFINNGNSNNFFVIEGKAGTGKTEIAARIIKEFKDKNVFVAALSHKAKNVIKGRFAQQNINANFYSIAALLGQKLDLETGEFTKIKTLNFDPPTPIEDAEILIIDEASMITEQALELIFENKPESAKVIFMGDIGQLAPIRSIKNKYYKNKEFLFNEKSPVFGNNKSYSWFVNNFEKYKLEEKVQLLERVRQGEESPILPFADYYWENNQKENPISDPVPANKRVNIINEKGALIFTNNFINIKDVTIDFYKKAIFEQNPYYIKFVTYTNATREAFNSYIHKAVFGENAEEYNTNELLIFQDTYGKIENATEIQIKEVSEKRTDADGLSFVFITFSLDENLPDSRIPILLKNSKILYNKLISEKFKEAFELKETNKYLYKQKLQDAWDFKNKYPNIDYSYALTSHKSQGSTYDIVIVDEKGIIAVNPISNKEKSESIYTSLTRAKNVAIVVSNTTVEDIIINPTDLKYENIILGESENQTKDEKLISSTKKACETILRIVDTFAHYGSFDAQATVKKLVSKPIDSYTREELENLYFQIFWVNKFAFEDLGISRTGGFHSKTFYEQKRIVAHLINKYKTEIESTDKGVTNKIRIPHKLTKDLSETELLYNVAGIIGHVVNRVNYVKQEVERWNNSKGYTKEGKVFKYNLEDTFDNEEIDRFSKLINHINSVNDIMVELENVKFVNQGVDLNPTQVAINYLILTGIEYRTDFNKIKADSKTLYTKYIKTLIAQNTDNPELLNSKELEKDIENAIYSMRDATNAQLNLDSPKDSTNVIIGNLIKKWSVLKNITLQNSNELNQKFTKLLLAIPNYETTPKEKRAELYEAVFEKNKAGERTGRIADPDLIQNPYLKAIAKFLIKEIGVLTEETNESNIVNNGYLPALAILNKSAWKVIKEKLGYFDSFDRNTKVFTDIEGNVLKKITQLYSNLIKPKKEIIIDLERKEGQTQKSYDLELQEKVFLLTGLSFTGEKQLKEYNAQVREYNSLLNSVSHEKNISYDLEKVIPLYITEAYQFNWKKSIENEFLMNMRMLSGQDFEVKLNTLEGNIRRYTGRNKNQSKKGSSSKVLKQLELWAHINLYNDYQEDSAKANKWGRVLQQYTSLAGLGLNPFSGINNVVYGTIQNKISSVADGAFNKKDQAKARSFYYSITALSSYFTDDSSSAKSTTLQSALIKELDIFNAQTEEVQRTKTDISYGSFEGSATYALNSLFFFQHAGEHMMQNVLMFSMLNGAKVIDGKIFTWKEFVQSKLEIGDTSESYESLKEKAQNNKKVLKQLKEEFESHKSVIDYFSLEEGYLVISKDLDKLELAKFKNKIKNKGQRLHGIYTKEDLSYMQKWVLGRWALQFKRWMRPGWNKRFGSRFLQDSGFIESYGERDKGSFKSLFDFVFLPVKRKLDSIDKKDKEEGKFAMAYLSLVGLISDYKNFMVHMGTYYNTLSFDEKAKVKQASIEISSFLLILLVLRFSRDFDDDKEELNNNHLFAFYLNQLDRLKSEMGGYIPLSIDGSGGWYNEASKLMRSPAATITTGENLTKLLFETAFLINGADESEYYKNGIYSGRLKAQVDLIKAIPIANQVQRWVYLPENNQYYRLSR